MEKAIIIINLIFISGILILIPYNYLYRNEVLQIKKQVGIAPPDLMNKLLKINIWLPLLIFFVALLITLFVR